MRAALAIPALPAAGPASAKAVEHVTLERGGVRLEITAVRATLFVAARGER